MEDFLKLNKYFKSTVFMNAIYQFLFLYVLQKQIVLVISSSFKKQGGHTPTK